jgi:methionyl-tRNA formyltransferase
MKFPKKEECRFCLVGSGKVLAEFSKSLIHNGFNKPLIVTWNSDLHRRDRDLLKNNDNYIDIFKFSNLNNIEVMEVENINDKDVIKILKSKKINIIFSISSRWIFNKHLISSFKGSTLNIHAGYLPKERGSVVYPKILNNVKTAGVTIHLIVPEIDAGPILFKKQQQIGMERPTIDFLTKKNIQISLELLGELLESIAHDVEIKEQSQDSGQGFFMPQPYTEVNGFIDWSWSVTHIESFIRAFGRPMPGSATFYKDDKIRILDAYIEDCEIEIHPLYYGRVVNVTKEGYVKVAANGGLIVIVKIKYNDKSISPGSVLKISNILYTPYKILENARIKSVLSLDMK